MLLPQLRLLLLVSGASTKKHLKVINDPMTKEQCRQDKFTPERQEYGGSSMIDMINQSVLIEQQSQRYSCDENKSICERRKNNKDDHAKEFERKKPFYFLRAQEDDGNH